LDGDLHDPVAPLAEEAIAVRDPIQRDAVGAASGRRPRSITAMSRRMRSLPPGHSVVTIR
jgi:hypothetical protein